MCADVFHELIAQRLEQSCSEADLLLGHLPEKTQPSYFWCGPSPPSQQASVEVADLLIHMNFSHHCMLRLLESNAQVDIM
jgi:hypothetical protein